MCAIVSNHLSGSQGAGPNCERRVPTNSRAFGDETQKPEAGENGKHSIEADSAKLEMDDLVPAWMLLCFLRTHGISPG